MEKENFLKHFMIIGAGTILNMVVGFITTPIITRLVTTDVYGQYNVFIMYAGIGLMILCMGLDQGIIRFYHEDDSQAYRRMLIRACCAIPICVTLIITTIAVMISKMGLYQFEFSAGVIAMLGLCVLLQIINRLNTIQLRAAYMTKQFSAINVIQKIVYVLMAIILIRFSVHKHFEYMVFATIMSYAAAVFVGIGFRKDDWKFWDVKYKGKFDYKGLYRYSAPFIISMGITTLFQAIDKMSLNIYCTYSDVGIYSSAMNIIHVFGIIQTSFNALWAPMAIEHYQQMPEDKSFYQKGNRIITIIMFFFGISLILFRDVFVLLLGESYRSATYLIPFLIFNPILYTISETTVMGIVFMKKSSMHIVIAAMACVTNVIGNAILVPKFGCKGAAIATGISYCVFFAARTVIANRYFKVDWKLGKLTVLIVSTVIYAFYNTFWDNIAGNIVGYFILLSVMALFYGDEIKECILIGKTQVIKMIKES